MESLRKKRAVIKGNVSRFRSYLNKFDESIGNVMELQLRLNTAEQQYSNYEDVQSQLEELGEEVNDSEREREEFECAYFQVIAAAKERVNALTIADTSTSTSSSQQNNTMSVAPLHIKLPTLNLPTFSGSYDQWCLYSNTFMSVIDSNEGLTNIQKFQYLRGSLTGDALQMIKSLEISDDNYSIAWKLLSDRYQNKRIIVHTHIKSLFELPSVQKESSSALRNLLDSYQRNIHALTALKQPTGTWDTLLIHLLSNKLDCASRKEWESIVAKKNHEELATVAEFTDFLQHRCQLLEMLDTTKEVNRSVISDKKQMSYGRSNNSRQSNTNTNSYLTTTDTCQICNKGNHPLFKCEKFLAFSSAERWENVKGMKLCYNCFKSDHMSNQCKAGACRKCNKKHNTLLHFCEAQSEATVENVAIEASSSGVQASTSNMSQTHHATANNRDISFVLLSTAVVKLYDRFGNEKYLKALLDSGSQSNFITKEACKILGLTFKPANLNVSGISNAVTSVTEVVNATVHSRINAFKATLRFYVMDKITENLPAVNIPVTSMTIPDNIVLADPTFYQASKIDMLIGAELFYDILCRGQFKQTRQSPTFQKSQFGWIISGRIVTGVKEQRSSCNFASSIEADVRRFWEIEEFAQDVNSINDKNECEEHFKSTVRRETNGRFIVRLPFQKNIDQLGDSKAIAEKGLQSMERKFVKQPDIKRQYIEFMTEYADLGHMTRAANIENTTVNFLPHHAVLRPDSSTTKLRVVFDGSVITSSNISLNDTLMKGPSIQQDLIYILLRFRKYNIVVTADIEKMYRQIKVHPEDANYQLILWRKMESLPMEIFKLNTVTYGTTCAPFLAVRCLKQLAIEERAEYPQAAQVLERDFYVDDLITGTNTHEEAIALKHSLTQLLKKGGFHLRKWKSNNSDVIQEHSTLAHGVLDIDKQVTGKILGLIWNSDLDVLQYIVKPMVQASRSHVTKRSILSVISQIYDPLGLIGPVITRAKVLLQQLWQFKLDWDESVPVDIYTAWMGYRSQLESLNSLCIPRRLSEQDNYNIIELHGFSDASQIAYGACIFIRTTNSQGSHSVRLLCSKSRVAPIKTISVPRLELCGSVLLANLMNKVKEALEIEFNNIVYWTDSTIVLSWIRAPANKWKTFVSNRVSEVHQFSTPDQWRHVRTMDNPADKISRGTTAVQLMENSLWWTGPAWLSEDSCNWPADSKAELPNEEVLELKPIIALSNQVHQELRVFSYFSCFLKLKRVIAYCHRFKHNALNRQQRRTGSLTTEELESAHISIMKHVQQQFNMEISDMKKGNSVANNSKLLPLHPFLDDKGIIRVGGRLRKANLSYDQRHPIVLPKNHYITKLIARHEHEKLMHAGPQSVLDSLRQTYWPLCGRNTVRDVTRKCIKCFKARPAPMTTLMGDLPLSRTEVCIRPFQTCGVDYCGPIQIRDSRRRGRISTTKAYVAVFVCFSTKAVHLELVGDLTTAAFINTLRRFTSRRGLCYNLYSDNATNFVGAKQELKQLYEFLCTNNEHIETELAKQKITWHNIPPRSPHFGGLWEAAVKSVKHHLRRVAGNSLFTYEELYSLLVQIEACLNSRPLTQLSNDPNDLAVLTPAHFIIGDSLLTPIEPNFENIPINKLARWELVQQIKQHFWRRWSREYLHQLQERGKWKKPGTKQLEVGHLVLIIEDNTPPLKWNMARVIELHPGADGVVRVATVKTSSSTFKRAVAKLCLLP